MTTVEEFRFDHDGGEWSAFRRAKKFLRDHGYAVGSTQRGGPVAAMHGFDYVAKWRNLNRRERRQAHVVLRPIGACTFRRSDVTVEIRSTAPNIGELRQSRREMVEGGSCHG